MPTAPSYAPLTTTVPLAAASTRTASSCPSALRTHCHDARSQNLRERMGQAQEQACLSEGMHAAWNDSKLRRDTLAALLPQGANHLLPPDSACRVDDSLPCAQPAPCPSPDGGVVAAAGHEEVAHRQRQHRLVVPLQHLGARQRVRRPHLRGWGL